MATGVSLTIDDDVATVTLVDPGGLHLLGTETLLALDACFQELSVRADLRAIVLTADGCRTFSAGADLREVRDLTPDSARVFAQLGQQVARRLADAPVVTVALLNAPAFGGGVELALACDLRVMVPSARLHYQASRLGILPGWGGTQRLPQLIGSARARQMLLHAHPVEAQQALDWGLVAAVMPSPSGAAWGEFLQPLRCADRTAIANIKRALWKPGADDERQEREAFVACFEVGLAQTLIDAWLKRDT